MGLSPVAFAFMLATAGCVTPAPKDLVREPLRVTNGDKPFAMWDGATARRAADATCGGKVRVSIYDRFDRDTGEWVYPGGCA